MKHRFKSNKEYFNWINKNKNKYKILKVIVSDNYIEVRYEQINI